MPELEIFLKSVAETNRFYKSVVSQKHISDPSNIMMYPILSRKQLQENRYKIFTDGYEKLHYAQQLISQSSSGTTGVPVYVYWDPKDYYCSMRVLWNRRLKYYGIHPYQKYVKFTLNSIPGEKYNDELIWVKESSNILNINRSSLRSSQNYRQLIEKIEEFEPKWLYIQPYILQKIVDAYITNGIAPPPSISYVESVGELLPLELKDRAAELYNAPVVNMYGSEEMNGIAYECPFHQMHILSENVYVECLNTKGIHSFGEGEAIITNLVNKAMPLIRYNQGDIITLENLHKPCPCGSVEPIVSKITGRVYENITVGELELNPYMLLSTLSNVNNQFSSIFTSYRFQYSKTNKRLVCYIELKEHKENWFENLKKEILSILIPEISIFGVTVEVCREAELHNWDSKHKFLEIVD